MSAQSDKNKSTAINFYDMMFNQSNPREAIELFVGDEYIQHNADVCNGRQGFIDYFEKMAREYPEKKLRLLERLPRII